jgi:hypothetical protein
VVKIAGHLQVVQDGARSRYRTDDLFHEVEAVKAFPTDNDTELERRKCLPAVKRWWIMGFAVMESTTSSMEMDPVERVCYQMLPGWERERCKYLKMVDLAGVEPATSSMPYKNRNLLTAKAKVGRVCPASSTLSARE